MQGNEIRTARRRLRLKQTQLAQLCDMRTETLSRVERGKMPAPPRMDLVIALISRGEDVLQFAMRFKGVKS